MGTPKALLQWGGATFFSEASDAVRQLSPARAVLVTNPELSGTLAAAWPGEVVVNGDPGSSQFDSLKLALAALDGDQLAGAFVLLVDNPGGVADRLRRLAQAAAARPGDLLVAAYGASPGHPIWIPARDWPSILGSDGDGGLRGWYSGTGRSPRHVEVGTPLALSDIDTPQDWEAFRHAMEQQ
jgi:CTP:molybdopterin cytidylyltransferase MocA